MLKCNKCLAFKSSDEFYFKNKLKGILNKACKECKKEYSKIHSRKPSVSLKRREQKEAYWKQIKEKDRKRRSEYASKLRKDGSQKLKNKLGVTLRNLLIGKIQSTSFDFGIDAQGLRSYFESLFLEGMNWNNSDIWEIDHITPKKLFDHSLEDEVKKCWHYTNLRPLWKRDNRLKSGTQYEKNINN